MNPSGYLPKLRPLDIKRVVNDGQGYLVLRDTLGLADGVVMVPEELGPLLALCDGTRYVGEISAAFQLSAGYPMPEARFGELIDSLAEALVFEDERFAKAYDEAKRAYRSAAYRPPALAGRAYPEDPEELARVFDGYCQAVGERSPNAAGPVAGVVSPHIDYERGWRVYADVWQRASSAIAETDLVIVFGTDHSGGPGKLTLTRQSYATPWGVLPTAQPIVDALAEALGEEEAFAEEIHHRNEHSIELPLTWLHYFLRPQTCEVVPVLCGSFHQLVAGLKEPNAHEGFAKALAVLRSASSGRRVLVVAAADFAHVGPAFGDAQPWEISDREELRSTDQSLLDAISEGDHDRFFHEIRGVEDRNRVCGMPPIYLALRLLAGVTGEPAGYEQCPADPENASLVSIAGAVLRRDT